MQIYVARDHHGYVALFGLLSAATDWLTEMSHIEGLTRGSSGIWWGDESGECSVELMEVRW